jgi:hypothetical protein
MGLRILLLFLTSVSKFLSVRHPGYAPAISRTYSHFRFEESGIGSRLSLCSAGMTKLEMFECCRAGVYPSSRNMPL